MTSSRQALGKWGEELAVEHLKQAGYVIRQRNWRCRSGEIDIIAECQGRLVFIEVRARRGSAQYGTAAESVDRRKQQQVRMTAQVYIQLSGCANMAIQFDVIAITLGSGNKVQELKHYEAAF